MAKITLCAQCVFWEEGEHDGLERAGTCRRWAPHPRVELLDKNTDKWTFWPATYGSDGCAEGEAHG